jgi:hypothetical protein
VLALVCRISLSPDSCVRQTEQIFARWGMKSIAVAKFVPGFSLLAPPLAGAMRASAPAFLVYDCVAGLLWSSLGIGAGLLFHREVDRILDLVTDFGVRALVGVAALLVAFAVWKWWQRRQFFHVLRMARISVAELAGLLDAGTPPLIFDVRSGLDRTGEPRRIPGAVALDTADLDRMLADLPRDREIVLYCT